MIVVERETWDALQAKRVGVRTRVKWRLGKDSDTGIDVTDRVTQISSHDRTMSPGIGGYQGGSLSLILNDNDGLFRPDVATSYLASGERGFLLTEIAIETGIQRQDGTFEYVPTLTAFVVYARWLHQQIEIRADGLLDVLYGLATNQDYTIQFRSATGARKELVTMLGEVIAQNSRFTSSSITVDADIAGLVKDGGWLLHGTFGRGAPVGGVLNDIARSAFGTLIESENGKLRVVGEHMPRTAGWSGEYVPFVFGPENSGPFQPLGTIAASASEVIAMTGNGAGSVAYRDATLEAPRLGRIGKTLELPVTPYAHQGWWAARIVQRSLAFPRPMQFPAHPVAAIVELNDRLMVQPEIGGPVLGCRCVGKSWAAPGQFGLAAVREAQADVIFEANVARYASSSWGGTPVML